MTVALVCGSKKPAAGQAARRSACRELLKVVERGVGNAGGEADFLDLATLELPCFDGRDVAAYGAPDLVDLDRRVRAAAGLVVAAPSYWGGVAGALKNALDLLGGAAYDAPGRTTPLAAKPVAVLVVGAGPGDARAGLTQLQGVLGCMGAHCLGEAVTVDNPRTCPDLGAVLERAFALGHLITLSVGAARPGRGG
jgi:NAD(P)H-dependent FMN reductase